MSCGAAGANRRRPPPPAAARAPCPPLFPLTHLSESAPQPAASYAKKQTLKFANGIAVPAELRAPGAAAAAAELQAQLAEWKLAAAPSSAVAPPVQPFVPKYVALDKQVLRFDGYITEVVPDSPLEAWRVRRVQLLCYLEDGSCQVVEPPMPNSGLVQGTLVRRHVLPRDGGGVLGPADLAVGAAARIYGRCVRGPGAGRRQPGSRAGGRRQGPWGVLRLHRPRPSPTPAATCT